MANDNLNKNQNNSKHWANKEERGSLYGMYFLVYTFKLLGATVCKLLVAPTIFYFYLFGKDARNNIKKFLNKVNNQGEVSISVSQWSIFRVMLGFGFGIVDKLSAWTGRMTLDKLNSVVDKEFRDYEKNGKGAILLISHLGNYEICRVAAERRSIAKFNVFMHRKNSSNISKIIKSMNQQDVISVIPSDELNLATVIELKEKVEAGEFIVISGDRTPVNNNKGTMESEFFGEMAKFPIGPYVLAKVLECPVFALTCLKNKNKYDVFFNLIIEKISFNKKNREQVLLESIKTYVKNLEKYAKIAPLQWYNFHQFWINK